jgi:hypothetical protein
MAGRSTRSLGVTRRTRLLKRFTCAVVCAVLGGCASYQPVPPGYGGPTATLSDFAIIEGQTKAQLFVVLEIDGHPVENSIGATATASRGQFFSLRTNIVERPIPVRPMKVKLKGTHATGAPIHNLLSQAVGTFYSVEGVVDFSPLPNKVYFVRGELKEQGSSVWITEEDTGGVPVTEKVFGK